MYILGALLIWLPVFSMAIDKTLSLYLGLTIYGGIAVYLTMN